MIIVIDGPAGSGKSSTAKAIANRLRIQYLDSGALYRAVTTIWIDAGKPDKSEFFEMLPGINLEAEFTNDTFFVKVNGSDISKKIRTQNVSNHVSEIAARPEVRRFVNRFMKKLVEEGIYIADGRDLGSAVFPDALLKFYMDASLDERARRRFEEMKENHPDITLKEIENNLTKRDLIDQSRKTDPLKMADDAIFIDTTGKTFEEQISEIIQIIEEKLKRKH